MTYEPYRPGGLEQALRRAKKRNPRAEFLFFRESSPSIRLVDRFWEYFKRTINEPWKEFEEWLESRNSSIGRYHQMLYAGEITHLPLPDDVEDDIVQNYMDGEIFCYTKGARRGERWKKYEDRLLSSRSYGDEETMISYAREIIKGRWKELEDKILREENVDLFFFYFEEILQTNRWYEAEYLLLTHDPDIYVGSTLSYVAHNLGSYMQLSGIRDRKEITLPILRSRPHLIENLSDQTKEEQMTAATHGGRQAFILIKDPCQEVRDMFPKLDDIRRSGMFR